MTAVQAFIDDIQGEKAWVEELNERSRSVARHFDKASAAEIQEALQRLAALFPRVPLVALGLVAINCGSLVERGGDPAIVGPALLERLPRINETAGDFYRRCKALAAADVTFLDELRQESEADAGDGEEDSGEGDRTPEAILEAHVADHGWQRLAGKFGPVLFQEHPSSVLGHMSEEFFRLGLIAHLSRSKSLRSTARARPELLEQTLQVDDVAGSHRSFLALMLRVLDDETLLVLHVEQRKGFEVRISGISDNFQLHTLLAGALIGEPAKGWIAGEAPSTRAVSECRDAPPDRSGGDYVTGAFNLVNWTGLQPDGTLPAGPRSDASQHWIWNEGCPAEIAPFEGRRVVLLGPRPYARNWRAGRQFPGMVGALTVQRTLGRAEVENWLHRLASAPRA
jgi:hypothetical protein